MSAGAPDTNSYFSFAHTRILYRVDGIETRSCSTGRGEEKQICRDTKKKPRPQRPNIWTECTLRRRRSIVIRRSKAFSPPVCHDLRGRDPFYSARRGWATTRTRPLFVFSACSDVVALATSTTGTEATTAAVEGSETNGESKPTGMCYYRKRKTRPRRSSTSHPETTERNLGIGVLVGRSQVEITLGSDEDELYRARS